MLKMKPKIFFIGFNKCGTKTISHFFKANAYRALHCRARPVVYDYLPRRFWLTGTVSAARVINSNIKKGYPVLRGLPPYRVYSDLTNVRDGQVIEACRFFRHFHREYQDSYFVLNVRPVEKWVRSRELHDGGNFIIRYSKYLGVSQEEVKDLWREMFNAHYRDAVNYFDGSQKFTVFDIENDAPDKLVTFLREDFELDRQVWTHKGATTHRVEAQA